MENMNPQHLPREELDPYGTEDAEAVFSDHLHCARLEIRAFNVCCNVHIHQDIN